MDATGPIAQRFPLIARPRPPCTALTARVRTLAALADRAATDGDLTAASRVHNQAALIASDCGQPELARTWCHRHARAYLGQAEPSPNAARYAIEPLVNLARLHIRASDAEAATTLLDNLYQAILTRTDTVIDGTPVPAAALTSASQSHRELSQWLWGVQLADGTRALTTAGRWQEAETRLQQHRGIGRHLLDGRQVAVIARAINSQHADARRLLAETQTGEPWQAAVAACLTALIPPTGHRQPNEHLETMVSRYRSMQPDPTLAVFRTRLALSIIDAIDDLDHPVAQSTTSELIREVLHCADGYAARDLVAHCSIAAATPEQTLGLSTVLEASGLDRPLPAPAVRRLEAALATSEAVIARIP